MTTVSISSPKCNKKMTVQCEARPGVAAESSESIACLECKREFSVLLPGPMIGGPFLE